MTKMIARVVKINDKLAFEMPEEVLMKYSLKVGDILLADTLDKEIKIFI